jgi:hypothetical protein
LSRPAAIVTGLLVGGIAGAIVLALVLRGRDGPATGPDDSSPPAAELTPDADPDGTTAGEDETRVRTMEVSIFLRAETTDLQLRRVPAEIVWFDSPIERARQLVSQNLAGAPDEKGSGPAPSGLGFHDVFVDDRRIAWIDLAGDTLNVLAGADVEESTVACLSRTLVENLAEVERVGFLVDGRTRRSLAGHVDISRTFTGAEWPVEGEAAREGEAVVEGASAVPEV